MDGVIGVLARIGSALFTAVLPTVATIASAYILRLLHLHLKKAKIELTAEQEQAIADLVEHAVLAVEERARRNPNMRSGEKQQLATQMVLAERPDLSANVVKDTIDETLARVRPTLSDTTKPAKPPSSAPVS